MNSQTIEQVAELRDRDRVIDLVAALIKARRGRPHRLPVVLLLGRRGSGGSSLLGQLAAGWRTRAPLARPNLEEAADLKTVVVATMAALKVKVPNIGAISFPRLELALIALDLDPSRTDAQLRAQLEARLRRGRAAALNRLQGQWSTTIRPVLSPDQQVAVAAGSQLFSWTLSGFSRYQRRKPLTWYGQWHEALIGQPSDGTPMGPLVQLAKWKGELDAANDRLRKPQQTRQDVAMAEREVRRASDKVDKTLCAALLADLSADFNDFSWRHGRRTMNCLLLLDRADTKAGVGSASADTGVGVRFLAVLNEVRGIAREAADPLVIVAAQSTRPALALNLDREARLSTSPDLNYGSWLAAEGRADHPSSWYPIRLADLRIEDSGKPGIVRSDILGARRYDAEFVRDVTRGHPLATVRLAEALRKFSAIPGFRPHDLLVAAPEGPPCLADELLECLLPQEWGVDLRTALAVAVATPALRVDECEHVFQRIRRRGIGAVTATEVRDRLDEHLWATVDRAAPSNLKLDPLLRTLLTSRLARTRATREDLADWQTIHGILAGYHGDKLANIDKRRDKLAEERDSASSQDALREIDRKHSDLVADQPRHQKAYWYHTLALTQPRDRRGFTAVAADLDKELDLMERQEWGRMLEEEIATAPNRLRTTEPQGEFASLLAGLIAEPANRGEVVRLLLAALWLHNDRLFDPSHRLATVIATQYQRLSVQTGNNDWFRQRSDFFSDLANRWGKAQS